MHLIKFQASFKYCYYSNGFCRKSQKSLSLAKLVITFFSCFFSSCNMGSSYKSWKGGFGWSLRHHKMISHKGNHVLYCDAVVLDATSLVEAVLQQTHIHLKLMSEDETEHSKTNKWKGILRWIASCLRYHPCAFCCSKSYWHWH